MDMPSASAARTDAAAIISLRLITPSLNLFFNGNKPSHLNRFVAVEQGLAWGILR
jgi:hypothetical protein